MVKIRLRRTGAKKQPHYRVVVADARSPRDGKFIEIIGSYNPRTEPPTMEVDAERAVYWLGVGAQPSAAVQRMLDRLGIMAQAVAIKEGKVSAGALGRQPELAQPETGLPETRPELTKARAKALVDEEELTLVEEDEEFEEDSYEEDEELEELEEWEPEVAESEEPDDFEDDWELDVDEDEDDFDDDEFDEDDA